MSFEAKERVRQATDIVDVIGGYMDLRRQGRMLVGLCPWHDDSKPSLQVNPERQSWKCWVCDDGGDIFSFVMKKEGVGFPEALKLLAEQAGIELDERRGPTATPGSPEDKATLYRAMAWAAEQFHRCLLYSDEADTARKYLQDRQIDTDSITRYRIGFSPNQWRWIIDQGRPHGFSPEVLEAVGLAIKSEKANSWYDRFRGRVLFPISDTQKRPIAIGGRVLPEFADDKSPKYINSPETRLYSKSEQLYGLDVVRDQVAKQRHLVVMEGYTDVVVARQFGVDNVVAVCGTALGARHIPLIRRFADSITLVLDGDEAGQRRTNQILELFIASQMDLRIVTLPEGLDPCDFLQQQGFVAFQSFLQSAIDALEHKIRSTTAGLDLIRDTHKANVALNELLTTLARAPKSQLGKTDAANVLREQQVLVRLAREFQLDEQQLRKQLEEIRKNLRTDFHLPSSQVPAKTTKLTLTPVERDLFEMQIMRPDSIPIILENIGLGDLQSDAAQTLYMRYAELESQGILPDFDRMILEFDDPAMKNLLVGLSESAGKKLQQDLDVEMALRELLESFLRRQTDAELRQQQRSLDSHDLDDEKKMELLLDLLKRRQELA